MSISFLDLTNIEDVMQSSVAYPINLTNYYDGNINTLKLTAGRCEEINNKICRVVNGDYQVIDSGIPDGIVFIHLRDNGDGTLQSFISSVSGIYSVSKKGWYNGNDKVLFSMIKSSGIYTNRFSMPTTDDENKRIGEIFPIHFDVLRKPNPFTYKKCDGVSLLDTNNFSIVNDTKVPNLTDDRFLQGASVYGVGGNLNNQVDFSHVHTIGTSTTIPNDGAGGGAVPSHTHTITTELSATQDIRPQYFSAEYYIRVI